MVISVRNCTVRSGVDTLYCARFSIGPKRDIFSLTYNSNNFTNIIIK